GGATARGPAGRARGARRDRRRGRDGVERHSRGDRHDTGRTEGQAMSTRSMRGARRFLAAMLVAMLTIAGLPVGRPAGVAQAAGAQDGAATGKGAAGAMLTRLSRAFIENRGQLAGGTAHDAVYYATAGGVTVFFTERGVRYELRGSREQVAVDFAGARR